MTNAEKFEKAFGFDINRIFGWEPQRLDAWLDASADDGWTPCKERLPNETEPWPVLCWIDDPQQNQIVGNPCYHDASYTGYSVVDGYGNVIARNCLAWRLLPEPYKGAEK